MRKRALAGVPIVVGALAAVYACGLEVTGSHSLPLDAGDLTDRSAPQELDAGIVDSGADADAEPLDCGVVTLDDTFEALDGGIWLRGTEDDNEPNPLAETIGSESRLALIKSNSPENVRGQVWLKDPVPLTDFDVDLDYRIECAVCGAGFAVAWLDTNDPIKLDDGLSGRSFGISHSANGGAVAIDLEKNSETNDPSVPSISVLRVDETQTPGSYDWHLSSSPQDDALVGTRRHLAIRVRGGAVTTHVGDAGVASAVAMSPISRGTLVLAASTSTNEAKYFVFNIRAKFYGCNPPPL